MPANLGAVPPTVKAENLVLSQCPEFYAEDTLILLQAIYLGLFWLGNSPTPPHSPFVYSPSYPQEKTFNFNCHSDLTSEPEEEQEPGAPADEPIELWDLNIVHNICN
ncbi:hypothetical protein DSO57_1037743 [Entomophthora muscae]|uniref:Uncharacterized protein n=2 Tax=Entomophthora muscae TaxID=34485 RepID=A0ACC2S1I7_9FUNG|nr:hypothetical protein DSO57_1035905 [Entomophthora muscae]KAJ9059803.1 hypothetical protein DSO57_1037743 [Entomophthora muscae]